MQNIDAQHSLLQQAQALLSEERNALANAANLAALIFAGLEQVNWAGFYFRHGDELVLGPFQGKLACSRIRLGQGVCGAAAASGLTQRIADVDRFPDHIACDSASRAELVVPLLHDDQVIGVLDIDAPVKDRFTAADQELIEQLAALWLAASDLYELRLFSDRERTE